MYLTLERYEKWGWSDLTNLIKFRLNYAYSLTIHIAPERSDEWLWFDLMALILLRLKDVQPITGSIFLELTTDWHLSSSHVILQQENPCHIQLLGQSRSVLHEIHVGGDIIMSTWTCSTHGNWHHQPQGIHMDLLLSCQLTWIISLYRVDGASIWNLMNAKQES
jgi:hypothetical protein